MLSSGSQNRPPPMVAIVGLPEMSSSDGCRLSCGARALKSPADSPQSVSSGDAIALLGRGGHHRKSPRGLPDPSSYPRGT
ncbi:hypothetical protein NDU88_003188 [Pleurodeles waltl]|uniref:Uncharacterized protein n=1 Tax=Pleurodeles waltl TaxID=8319 RepID=A0AAV7L156_PLEWA|nr:hypothetical protein NDU88_003188 [Pleurodeles waltl]